MIDISVVIVNYKSWNALRECLEAITAIDNNTFILETIVVDNHSNDGEINKFKNIFPDVIFVENTGNNGFSNGCNTGANVAKGDCLFFLNPDTIANENAIYALWNTTKKNPDYGIVTCAQINEKKITYKEIRFFPSLKTLFGPFRALNLYFNKRKIEINFDKNKHIIFPEWATGAVIFMSKNWFVKVNGWNEKYWLYYEDVDICKKVIKQGGKIVLLRNTSILHKHGGASRINIQTKALTKTEVLISKHVYFHEHTKGFEQILIQILILVFLFLEKTILALLGGIFFFIPKLKVNIYIYKNLLAYYFSAICNKSWTSPRSMQYQKH
jgi:GT2 family glycosyltransferase